MTCVGSADVEQKFEFPAGVGFDNDGGGTEKSIVATSGVTIGPLERRL